MKKPRKNLESSPYRIYVSIMRRLLLNNMALLVIVSMTAGSIAAQDALQPTFIVLTPAADFNAETARLELDGKTFVLELVSDKKIETVRVLLH